LTLLVLRVEGDRAVSVNLHGTEEAPVHRSAARELARLADLAPSGHVAWLDRRMETGLTPPGAWPALLRHDLEVLHAGGGSRMAPSLGLVDFDSPWLLDAPPGCRFDTWLISPAAGIARGAALRAVGIEPDGWSFGAALFDLGRRGVPLGLIPVAEPRLLQESLPALPELRPAEVARLVRRGYGRKWVAFWMLARRLPSLAAPRGWLAPGPDDPDRAALEALRPVLPREKDAAVDVLIPTLGRPEHLRALLEDLAGQTLKPRRVIVVEQGDPHPGLADGGFPFEVRLLSLPRPGACRARNAGLREVRSEWVLLLDDDVRLRPGLIERLVSVARAYDAGAVNARVHLPGQEMGVEPGPPRLWPSFSSGAALVSARTLLESGGFDEHLDGGYGEDYELGVRLRLLGASVLYDPAEPILHLKAPAGGFRAPFPLPWNGDDPPPRPSPFILYARRKHLTSQMREGYRLFYTLSRLGAARLWRWPAELRRIRRQWERSEHWADRLLDERTVPGVRRLCIVSHVVHYRHGGKVHAYAPYAREIQMWADLFPEVRIAAPCEDGPPPGDSAPIDRSNVDVDPQPRTGGDSLGAKVKQALLLPVLAAFLAWSLRKADAVHVRCPGNLGLLGVVMAPLFSRRLIAKYAGQWNGFPGEARTVRLQRAILRSGWWKGPVTVYGSWPDQPPWIVPFFTSVLDRDQIERARRAAAARTPKDRPRVLFVGRLSRAKNVGALLDALAWTGLPCTIVGDGPERGALEAQAARLGLDVHFAGAVDFERVLGFYETHDVLVLASETEGWPKAIVEAMAFGLVCIGSERGLIPQILGEGRGFVVPPRDVDTLAAALRRAANPAEVGPILERAAVFGQRYSLEDLREALRELMTERWT
jgi:glycosyltransferase involved in cell wall biosynthesis